MKRFFFAVVLFFEVILTNVNIIYPMADVRTAVEEPTGLYGLSALLMDADTGRVLFEKDGYRPMPMASTTKILTCLLALEVADPEDVVEVSELAASQPDVQMNICEGERYRLIDLLYGLMLESYNDAAVAIAEHVCGSVEAFADLMNEKAASIGCMDSHFVTPNGLDRSDEGGEHRTTARDLALILSYAIQNKTFLSITQTRSYTIEELDGKRTAIANNHNALLDSMEGAISGKTGFTGRAGFCYAGAVQRDNRTLVAVTLACGWPPHKNYKWQDMQKLFDYGFSNFQKMEFHTSDIPFLQDIPVPDGKTDSLSGCAMIRPAVKEESFEVLLREDESLTVTAELPDILEAPVQKGQIVGKIIYELKGERIKELSVFAEDQVLKKDALWYLGQAERYFFVKNVSNLPECY